ncbi:histidine kinase [Metabacillus indicus]|uniref:sensor histidine kinase n=1 Tax=Metabacillus indicus TaxID=246786 RepID=UPI002A02BE96|nr:histidine kinase [Metabacillus indicus]MDX8290535.1 histidine kinase [Metabacillus indicus]
MKTIKNPQNRTNTLTGKVRSLSIFHRLLLAFFLVIIIFSTVIITVVYDVVEDRIYETNINYVSQNVEAVKRLINKELDSYKSAAAEFAEEASAALKSAEELDPESEEFREKEAEINDKLYSFFSNPYVKNAQIVTKENEYVQRSIEGEERGARLADIAQFAQSQVYKRGASIPYQPAFHNTIRETGVYYTGNNISLGNYLTITTPVLSDSKEYLGLLILNVDISFLTGSMDFKKQFNQDLYIADQKGIISSLSNHYSFLYYPEEIWERIYSEDVGVAEFSLEKGNRIAVYDQLGVRDWKVISLLNVDDLMADAHTIRNRILLLTSIALILSAGICIFVTSTIYNPLKKLVQSMKSFGEHNVVTVYDDPYQDEIGSAGRQFLTMVKQVNRAVQKELEIEKLHHSEKLKRKEAELKALQMQINPHFIYNTLDIIRWKTMRLENGAGPVSSTIGGFAKLLRYNISIDEGLVKVHEELAHIEQYVGILSLLHDTEISLQKKIEPEEMASWHIPKFIFQPIVENAVIHGKIHQSENGAIHLMMREEKGALYIEFSNNGKSITRERAEHIQNKLMNPEHEKGSIGLGNIHDRIRLLFGEEYGIKVNVSNEEKLKVTIRLPIIKNN